jgi:hypothetical protein
MLHGEPSFFVDLAQTMAALQSRQVASNGFRSALSDMPVEYAERVTWEHRRWRMTETAGPERRVDLTVKTFGVLLEAASIGLPRSLWRGREPIASKLLWTVVLLVPFLGIVAFAVWHDPPSPSDPIDRPPGGDWDVTSRGHI